MEETDMLDALGRVTRMAMRLRNKYPEHFSENDKKIISICQDIMIKNAKIKESEKLIRSNKT